MSAVPLLRANDPATTRIHILLRRETSDALAGSLEQNTFVRELELNLEGEQRADWNSLLRAIAMRANLEKVTLEDAYLDEERNATAALVRAFMQAIQQNTSIQSVELRTIRLPTDISTFVDNASSITSFRLYQCDGEPAEREQGARDLAAALQRNKNIQSLGLYRLNDIYTTPILEGLRSNVFLKTFIFNRSFSFTEVSDATSHALQHLLESTTSIQRFEFFNATFSGDTFRTVAQAISSSGSVSELKIEWCRFEDQSSIAQLRSILQNKQNLSSLCLHHCAFAGGQVHEAIISVIPRPESLLRML